MQENNYNLGIRMEVGEKYAAGIAYIVIPSDIDRDVYINECYKSSTVSIYSEMNGFNNRVYIDKYSLNFIEFPLTVEKFGSPVSFKVHPVMNMPFIDGIYFNSSELSELKENQFKFKRKLKENFVEIAGSSSEKYLGLNVKADVGGKVYVNVRSVDQSGEINLHADGDVNIQATNNLNLNQSGKFQCVTSSNNDDSEYTVFEQTSTEQSFSNIKHNIYTNTLNINEGKEPFVLGKQFAAFMKDFIDQVGAITTTTALGQMPILNKTQIIQFKDKVDALLSIVAFIDK